MVAILEPFIDTLLICTLTGLVILSSGVWTQKFQTEFSTFDTEFVAGRYSETNPQQVEQLFAHLGIATLVDDPVKAYSGTLQVIGGVASTGGYTVIHNRSIAESVRFASNEIPFTGSVQVSDGEVTTPDITMSGRSLLHSVPLTAMAFKQSFLGDFGQYVVTIGLVLFAFSTALAWSYYGDRAVTYLFGLRWVTLYRVAYVIGFFAATIVDTSLIWLISAVTLALMTIPNLIGLMLMRKELKSLTRDYWDRFKTR
jgi:AGCS family alanine or glycine:cation symporter